MIPILLSFNTNGTSADGQRSLVGHGPQGHKKSDTTEVTKQTQQFQVTSQKMLSGLNPLGKSSQTSKAFFVRSFPRGSHSKESACNAGDPGMIPGSGRSMEYIYSSILAWRISQTEKSGRLQSMGCQRLGHK